MIMPFSSYLDSLMHWMEFGERKWLNGKGRTSKSSRNLGVVVRCMESDRLCLIT